MYIIDFLYAYCVVVVAQYARDFFSFLKCVIESQTMPPNWFRTQLLLIAIIF